MFQQSLSYKSVLIIIALAVMPHLTALASPPAGQPAQFEIMNWGGAPSTPAALKRVKECGFTIAGNMTAGQAETGALDTVQAAGLKAFVWPKLQEIESLINNKKISDHPALAGYLIGSEFSTAQFPELAAANKLLKTSLPAKIPLMNLFPAFVNPERVEAKSYQDFLDRYVEDCKPAVLCYDQYALMEDGTINNNFWNSLEVMRNQSLKSNIPFWNVVQAVGHLFYREPSAADFLFQAYCTVAYGGKGIAYFTYRAYPNGNYRGAPVDQFGNETAAWQYLATTNHQILALAPYLMKMRSNDVYHFGEIPPACHGPQQNSLIAEMAGNFLVGDFTDEDGNRYVLIVNKDLHKSQVIYPKFRDPTVTGVEKVSAFREGELIPLDDEERFLAPGQGMLLKLTHR